MNNRIKNIDKGIRMLLISYKHNKNFKSYYKTFSNDINNYFYNQVKKTISRNVNVTNNKLKKEYK
jgi:hypothetical protein